MGTWTKQTDTQNRTDNIPATPGETTYNSDLYYIGLLKNGEPITITTSDFKITNHEWIKDVSFNKRQNDNYYQLTYKVDENTDKSERVGHISIKHDAANKIIDYYITQSANTTQEPTEPTPNTYDFSVTNYTGPQNYPLQVGDYNSESGGSVASINAGDQSNSEQLDINITMSNPYKSALQSELKFKFEISCNNLESFDAVIYNDDVGGEKTVYIQHSQSNIGELKIESIRPGLVISITIFRGGQMSIIEQPQLSEDITGTITINSDIIPFIVTFGFI